MFLEVVSPEAVLFSSEEVNSISVPGVNGEFQMLNNHAPIVSILQKGTINIEVANVNQDELHGAIVAGKDGKSLSIEIKSGTIELNDNKAIILVD